MESETMTIEEIAKIATEAAAEYAREAVYWSGYKIRPVGEYHVHGEIFRDGRRIPARLPAAYLLDALWAKRAGVSLTIPESIGGDVMDVDYTILPPWEDAPAENGWVDLKDFLGERAGIRLRTLNALASNL